MIDPDTVNVILNNSSNSGLSVKEIYSMIIDFLTIAAVFLGLYLGNEGLKKYLLKDAIKRRVGRLQNANEGVKDLTNKIIEKVDQKDDTTRPVDDFDLIDISSLSKKLENKSIESSTQVRTLSYFLYKTIQDIKPRIEKDNYGEIRIAKDFYNLVFNTCNKINYYASNIIEIPENIDTEDHYEIKKELRKYLSSSGFKKVKDIEHGLNLNPNSELALVFSNLINNSTSNYVFKRNFFRILESNIPLIHELYYSKLYFPPILKSQDLDLFGENKFIKLVKYQPQKPLFGEGKRTVKLFYSNLSYRLKFVDSLDFSELINKFNDSFITEEDFRHQYINDQKFTNIGNETIKVICDTDDLKSYYKDVKRSFKKKLKSIEENA